MKITWEVAAGVLIGGLALDGAHQVIAYLAKKINPTEPRVIYEPAQIQSQPPRTLYTYPSPPRQ